VLVTEELRRSVPVVGGARSAGQIERELARLRMNENGILGARASLLNLIVVTSEERAPSVTRAVCELSGRYPSRAILMISDPDEEEANLEVGISAFCRARGGGGRQVCAEQITVHVEGPPAGHLQNLADPLLIPDLPVFLWYPSGEFNHSPECAGMAALADRLILDSGAARDCEAFLQDVANLLEDRVLAVGDLQWTALSSWRSLVADLFASPERAGELAKIRHAEIVHGSDGECQALLFIGWLSSALGWRLESAEGTERGRLFRFATSSGEAIVELAPNAPEAALHQVHIFSENLAFQIQASHHKEHTDAHSTVMRGDEPISERTVYLGSSDVSVLLGEELKLLGRDETHESSLKRVVEMLDLL
jgi:glucose-6-phosphate dehydrogenase assembly protein OpcA